MVHKIAVLSGDGVGPEIIQEGVLSELFQSPEVQRLRGICQHGVTDF